MPLINKTTTTTATNSSITTTQTLNIITTSPSATATKTTNVLTKSMPATPIQLQPPPTATASSYATTNFVPYSMIGECSRGVEESKNRRVDKYMPPSYPNFTLDITDEYGNAASSADTAAAARRLVAGYAADYRNPDDDEYDEDDGDDDDDDDDENVEEDEDDDLEDLNEDSSLAMITPPPPYDTPHHRDHHHQQQQHQHAHGQHYSPAKSAPTPSSRKFLFQNREIFNISTAQHGSHSAHTPSGSSFASAITPTKLSAAAAAMFATAPQMVQLNRKWTNLHRKRRRRNSSSGDSKELDKLVLQSVDWDENDIY